MFDKCHCQDEQIFQVNANWWLSKCWWDQEPWRSSDWYSLFTLSDNHGCTPWVWLSSFLSKYHKMLFEISWKFWEFNVNNIIIESYKQHTGWLLHLLSSIVGSVLKKSTLDARRKLKITSHNWYLYLFLHFAKLWETQKVMWACFINLLTNDTSSKCTLRLRCSIYYATTT